MALWPTPGSSVTSASGSALFAGQRGGHRGYVGVFTVQRVRGRVAAGGPAAPVHGRHPPAPGTEFLVPSTIRQPTRAGRRATLLNVITGVHAIMFSPDAAKVRAFLADVLGLDSVDAGGGWLIFALPPAELAVHPADGAPRHELYLMCDDIEATLAELRGKGVEVAREVSDQGWGLLAAIRLPDGTEFPIYQPRHASPITTS